MSATIAFRCPQCQAERRVARALLGRRTKCPACDETVEIVEYFAPPGEQALIDDTTLPEELFADVEVDPVKKPAAARAHPVAPAGEMVEPAPIESPPSTDASSDLSVIEPIIVGHGNASPDDVTAPYSIVLEPVHEPTPPPVQGRWKGAPEPKPPPPPPKEVEEEENPEQVVFKKKIIEGEIDMTPMIDVTFLLLIFFICTASFTLLLTKQIPAPKEDEPSTNAQTVEDYQDDPDNITVRIDAFNTFQIIAADSVDETPSYQELVTKLRAARQVGASGKAPTTLMVIANNLSTHEKVVQALDAGTEVGLEKMQLMWVDEDDNKSN